METYREFISTANPKRLKTISIIPWYTWALTKESGLFSRSACRFTFEVEEDGGLRNKENTYSKQAFRPPRGNLGRGSSPRVSVEVAAAEFLPLDGFELILSWVARAEPKNRL